MAETANRFNPRPFLAPRYWPVWLGLGLLRLLIVPPFRWQQRIGAFVGNLSYYFAPSRRRSAEINIAHCFPELDAKAQQRLVRRVFRSTGIALVETPLAWWGKREDIAPLGQIEGLDNLERALAQGKGVILLGAHNTSMEMGGRILTLSHPFAGIYRPDNNPLLNAVIKHAREVHMERLIPRFDMRGMIKALKQGSAVWYPPDQDFGIKNSVFAPFFGVATATLTTTSKLAKLSGAAVVPFFTERLEGGKGYRLHLMPALDNFPSGDDVADATRYNQLIEEFVRRVPDQYLWIHRRFKTRPSGEADFYGRPGK